MADELISHTGHAAGNVPAASPLAEAKFDADAIPAPESHADAETAIDNNSHSQAAGAALSAAHAQGLPASRAWNHQSETASAPSVTCTGPSAPKHHGPSISPMGSMGTNAEGRVADHNTPCKVISTLGEILRSYFLQHPICS